MSPILGIWASQNYSRYQLPTSYESIATTTVGSGGSSSITFSSIPSTYTHLQIRAIIRSNRVSTYDSIRVRFNSDTGNNYAYHILYGDGSSAAASADINLSYIFSGYATAASATSGIFAANVIDVLDYANTNKNKTLRNLSGSDENGAGFIWLASGLWRSTSAITSINLSPLNGTLFTQYSHFALYGCKI